MKKHRVCTTISTKSWELLKKYTEKYGTQQKVLDLSLENFEKCQTQSLLSQEEQLWIRLYRELKAICILHKDIFFEMARTANFERLAEVMSRLKLSEYQVVWYYQKPLKECSLEEVIYGIVATSKLGNWFDTVTYTDDGNYYTLKVIHSIGSNNYSKSIKLFFESLFKAYGANIKSDMSENSFFMKIFKM